MSRYRTFKQLLQTVTNKIGEVSTNQTLADWITDALNERFRYAATFAQWPDYMIWESRIPNTSSYILYQQTGFQEIGYVWGVYGNGPLDKLSTVTPMNYLLDNTGVFVEYPNPVTGETVPDGSTSTVWIHYTPSFPLFTNVAWDETVTYAVGDTVYDPTTGDCYVALLSSTGTSVTDTATWKRIYIPSYLYNYLAHSCYAQYLLSVKQNDKAKTEEDYAERILLWPEKQRLYAQNQRPVVRNSTNISQQSRRM